MHRPGLETRLKLAAGSICVGVATSAQAATFYGPSGGGGFAGEYVRFADSPFAGVDFSGGYFHLENFEDPGQAIIVPGVTPSSGFFSRTGFDVGAVDSVDLDDGVLDGNGNGGESWWAQGGPGTTWTFDAGILGALPTHVGVVWTDGNNPISFEAFDSLGLSLGTVSGSHATALTSGQTDEDRFYGVFDAGGIGSINLRNDTAGGIEMDHLQFGNPSVDPIPVPAAIWLFGSALLGLVGFGRCRGSA